MDKNTRDVLLIAIPLVGTVFSGFVALQQVPAIAKKVEVVDLKVDAVTKKTGDITGTIETLEKNTNSIKDALVKTTAEASEAKGKLKEQDAQKGRETAEASRRRAADKQILESAQRLKGEKR